MISSNVANNLVGVGRCAGLTAIILVTNATSAASTSGRTSVTNGRGAVPCFWMISSESAPENGIRWVRQ